MPEGEDDGDVDEAMRECSQAKEPATRRGSTDFSILDINFDRASSAIGGGGFFPDSAPPSKEKEVEEEERVEAKAAIGNITANSDRQINRDIARANEDLIHIPDDSVDREEDSMAGKKFSQESANMGEEAEEEEETRVVDDRDFTIHHYHRRHRGSLLDRDDDDDHHHHHHHHDKVKAEDEEEADKNEGVLDDETDELASLISHDPDDDDAEPEWLVGD